SGTNSDTTAESNINSKSKVSENSVSPTIFNQALFASGKPEPNHQQQQEKTELKVSLCWETMNSDNNKAFINSDSDFGQLNFENWDFGSTLDASRQDVKNEFAKIKFKIIDKTDNNKVVAETTGTYDPNTATYATKSLGSYDSSHTYIVSVVNSTVPSPYYVTYNNVSTNEGEAFDPDATYFTWTPSKGSDKKSQNKYFRLNVLEIVYAKDENVASKCFSYSQPQINNKYQSDGDWKFTYDKTGNIFARLRVKDNAIQFPKDKDGNPTHPTKAGFKFAGWQFYVARKATNKRPYTSYDRMFDDDKKIIDNTTVDYVPFNEQTTTYPYLFAVIRDSKGVNTFGSKLGTQYCTTNHTFVVFPKWEKEAGHTVTFMNEGSEYAKVKVQEGKSIDTDALTDQSMPSNPSKYGYSFRGWNTQADGLGSAFLASTTVKNDMTVYAIYTNYPPTLTLQDKTITEGDLLDLNSLIVSATDSEDGDLTSKVKLTNNGGFDNTKVGSYKVTFSVTDNGGASATASATVTVAKKPVPLTKLNIAPTLTLQDKTITEGDTLDLKTLIVSAQDPEDGDLTSKVKLTNNGGFDNTKVGSYKITFSVTDSGKASVVKSATVTVAKKPVQPKPEEPIPDIDWDDIPTPDTTPDTEPIPTLTPIPTPTPVPVTPTPDQPEQPTTQPVSHTPAHAAKHLPQTGVSVASILAAAIASLFAGVASLGATSKRHRKN
ncbi:InlB B-repeat-containing protein, partial [Gardnerella vaginalis]|uniref:InlB B-repeat-containing protein n=1 Tax=Gardnerella vaginalis TaxID=2702 RepID=UPI000E3223B6